MLTTTKLAIAAVLFASSAYGALAQSQIGNGAPAPFMRPLAKLHDAAPPYKFVSPRRTGAPVYENEVPFAPF